MSDSRYDVRLYSYACDYDEVPSKRVSELGDVAFDEHFQRSDLVVFHFGVFYPLFDLVFAAPKSAKRLVVFHNITPKEFVSPDAVPIVERSFRQMANISFAHHVTCVSQTNLDVLRRAGITTPGSVIPIAIHNIGALPSRKPSFADGLVRIAFIGRFVRAKGPVELLEATQDILRRNKSLRLRIDLVGNTSFSSPDVLNEAKCRAVAIERECPGRANVRILGDATEDAKASSLKEADLFVLPTYHEGYCVPVLEALANGCKVVAYNNSNIPAISGGFAHLVPTGNTRALAVAMEQEIEEILSTSWRADEAGGYQDYAGRASRHTEEYSPAEVRRRFLNFVRQFARRGARAEVE